MKKLNILSIIMLMSVAIGCTDLEEEPIGLLAPESMFKTTKDVETAVMGTYGRIASEEYYGRKLVLSLQLLSDMCDIGDRGTPSRRQDINDFNADANNGMVSALWPRSYDIISAANAALDGADRIDATEKELNPLRAEARFVRAFAYYHLVRLFGDIPYIDFFITDPFSVKDIPKTSASEIYTHIIDDFTYAKDNLPDVQNSRSRPSVATAAAYLASVQLTLENWQAAYDNAKMVINNKSVYGIDLEADYQDLFKVEGQYSLIEPLLTVDFLGQQNSWPENVDYMGPITGIRGAVPTGWSVSVPSMAVYENWDDRDYRKTVAFDDTVVFDDGTVYPYTDYKDVQRPHIAKYHRFFGTANADGSISDNNYNAMRYAEVLLIAAEALNEISGPTTEAQGYVNQVRERARNQNGTITDFPEDVPTGISKDDFRDLVLEERRLELSFEYKRWYDIKRRQLGDEAFKSANSLEPHPNFDASKHYLLPLPQKDLDINPNLLPQNPGY